MVFLLLTELALELGVWVTRKTVVYTYRGIKWGIGSLWCRNDAPQSANTEHPNNDSAENNAEMWERINELQALVQEQDARLRSVGKISHRALQNADFLQQQNLSD